MAKLRRIDLTAEQVAAINDDYFAYYKELIIPKQSWPTIPPKYMEPRMIDGQIETDDYGSPVWRGYHPMYPTGSKWFTQDFGGRGTVLKVRGHKLYVEIMDIVAEENDQGAWQWSIKLVKNR